MSDHIEDEELKGLIKSGVKILTRKPAAAAPEKEDSEAEKIISAIETLGDKIATLADRPAPEVKVAAPNVRFEPRINVETPKPPRKYRVEVIERDKSADQRIKVMTIEAVD